MPLTRSRKTELEPRSAEMAASSDEEFNGGEERFSSAQEEESPRKDLSDLRKFELAQAHEFRMRQLELEKEERRRQIEVEKERMDREAEIEREKIALEKERMSFELRRLELLNQNNNNNRNSNSEEGQLSKADLKKFPSFKQGDCPEAFLTLFERACADFSVRESEKMIILRSQISGCLAEVYAEMPIEMIKNYSEF